MAGSRTSRARPPRYQNGRWSPGGPLQEFRTDYLGLMSRMASMGSPLVATRIGAWPTLLVFDGDLARDVLVTDEESYDRPWPVVRIMVEGLGRNLFTATGEPWSRRRRLLQVQFTRSHVDDLVGLMATTISHEVDGWETDTTVDLQALLTNLTLAVAARALMGLDIRQHELGRQLRRDFEPILRWMNHRFSCVTSPPALVPTRRNREMARHRAALRATVEQLIAEHRRSPDRPADVLQALIEGRDRGDVSLTDDEIVEECIGFLFAGHETTASALSWAMYFLATIPQVQDRVAAEGHRLLAEGVPAAAALHDLRYTACVFEEAMRLYPPAVAIVRTARRATSLGGYALRRGTVVVIAVYAIQRDPRRWTEPDVFNPDRFAGEGHAAPARGAHLPFGLGPRHCLGARFATTEACLALATITSRRRVTLSRPFEARPRVELAPRIEGGLPVRLSPR